MSAVDYEALRLELREITGEPTCGMARGFELMLLHLLGEYSPGERVAFLDEMREARKVRTEQER